MFFSLFGANEMSEKAAMGNGMLLTVLIYFAADASGGHLNPAVTIAALMAGEITPILVRATFARVSADPECRRACMSSCSLRADLLAYLSARR